MALLAAAIWASGKTLLSARSELETCASSLTAEAWTRVSDAFGSIQWHTQTLPNGRLRKSGQVVEAPADVLDRLLPLFVTRGSAEVRRSLYETRLADYRGDDRATLESAQTVAFELIGTTECDWSRELDVIAHAYSHGALGETAIADRVYGHRHRELLSPEAAASVADAVDRYPSVLVQYAQSACADAAMRDLVPVAVAARNAGWFDS